MSNFYLDVAKDRLYTSAPDAKIRRSCQTAMYIVLHSLVRMLAPVLAFTSEKCEVLPHTKEDNAESVQLNSWLRLTLSMITLSLVISGID